MANRTATANRTAAANRAATANRVAAADRAAAAAPPSPAQLAEVRARLWGLCSPLPPGGYEPPWAAIAADLWERLGAALGSAAALEAAAPASHLAFAACAKALSRGSPQVHRLLAEVRGLALAAAPALVEAEKGGARAEAMPGAALVYEAIAY